MRPRARRDRVGNFTQVLFSTALWEPLSSQHPEIRASRAPSVGPLPSGMVLRYLLDFLPSAHSVPPSLPLWGPLMA